jgi:hypothetical protein
VAMVFLADLNRPGEVPEVKSPIAGDPGPGANVEALAAEDKPPDSNTEADASNADQPDSAKPAEVATAPAKEKQKSTSGSGANDGVFGPSELEMEELKRLEKELGKDFQFRVKDGKLVTEGVIVDSNGVLIKPSRPGESGIRIPLSPEEFDQMTPAQKRKLRNALEQRRRAEERARQIESAKPVPAPPEPPPSNKP